MANLTDDGNIPMDRSNNPLTDDLPTPASTAFYVLFNMRIFLAKRANRNATILAAMRQYSPPA
jgi:hypothetical protein